MQSLASKSILLALLGTAILVVCSNAWLAFHSVEAVSQSQQWVDHTWQVIDTLERVTDSLDRAETSTRGYLLSGDASYLAPYQRAKAVLPGELTAIAGLVTDNPQEVRAARELRAVAARRMSLLEESIEERQAQQVNLGRLQVLGSTGRAEMTHARSLVASMQQSEHRLLAQRAVTSRRDAGRARITVIFASTVDLLLLLLTFRYIAIERRLRRHSDQTAERLSQARKEAEAKAEEVRLLNEELEQRVARRTAELEDTNRELEAFSYSVSHDLRAPLRTVDGFSLALEEDYGKIFDATGQDYLRRIRDGVQRMGHLIDSLLQLSRITRAELIRESVNLSALATTVAEELRAHNPGRNMVFNIQPGLEATGDSRLLRSAFENLLGNAVKFTARESEAHIEVGYSENVYFIRDNGAGFDMRYANKLFTAFHRLHGDRDFRGSGIGLATVARIIHRHRGKIWAEGEVGQGATFWFTLG